MRLSRIICLPELSVSRFAVAFALNPEPRLGPSLFQRRAGWTFLQIAGCRTASILNLKIS